MERLKFDMRDDYFAVRSYVVRNSRKVVGIRRLIDITQDLVTILDPGFPELSLWAEWGSSGVCPRKKDPEAEGNRNHPNDYK